MTLSPRNDLFRFVISPLFKIQKECWKVLGLIKEPVPNVLVSGQIFIRGLNFSAVAPHPPPWSPSSFPACTCGVQCLRQHKGHDFEYWYPEQEGLFYVEEWHNTIFVLFHCKSGTRPNKLTSNIFNHFVFIETIRKSFDYI